MKKAPFFSLFFLSLSLYGAMGSSVTIPLREHDKYTFGHPRNQAVHEMEKRQYYNSMAPMKKEDIRNHLSSQGYSVRGITLRDIHSELAYEVYVSDSSGKRLLLYIDPSNGSILRTEPLQ
ncbi:MAG: PepSY domain-containing protein [Sulfuricurvum sp.]|nr:PepSY domain-containing protein [Sulfuricurvum sp.]